MELKKELLLKKENKTLKYKKDDKCSNKKIIK